ncbi:YOD1 family protein [Megaselia abdita]
MAGPKLISIKLKSSKLGQQILQNLSSEMTVKELKMKIAELTNIKWNLIKVLSGFPPQPIDMSKDSQNIETCGIKNGDTLIIDETVEQSSAASSQTITKSNDEEFISREYDQPEGIIMKQVVPADNSCLFTSFGYILNGKVDTNCGSFMREIIASHMAGDPSTYNEGILGKPNNEYCEWIKKSDSWGGAIEVSILSNLYGIEIDVVDVTNVIINRFGEDKNFGMRGFLMFDGIHYDPLFLQTFSGGNPMTIFPTEDEKVYKQVQEFAVECNQSRQYTNVEKFSLRCLQCNTVLVGQNQAQDHAKQTGHTNFGEI